MRENDLRGTFTWPRRTLQSQYRAARRLVHTCFFRPRRRSGSAPPQRPRGHGFRRHLAAPYPFATSSKPQDTQGIERGWLRFPPRDPLRNRPGRSRTSHAGRRFARPQRGHFRSLARRSPGYRDSKPGSWRRVCRSGSEGSSRRRAGCGSLPSFEELEGCCRSGVQAAHRSPGSGSDSGRTFPKTDEPPPGPQSFKGIYERAGTEALPVHPRTLEERRFGTSARRSLMSRTSSTSPRSGCTRTTSSG